MERSRSMEEESNVEREFNIEEESNMEGESDMEEDSLWWGWESFFSWYSDGIEEYSLSICPMGFIELPSDSAMDAAGTSHVVPTPKSLQ